MHYFVRNPLFSRLWLVFLIIRFTIFIMTKKRQQVYACAMEAALSIISGKWKLTILNQLLTGTMRYSEIKNRIPGITEKMLSQQLKELEVDGIIIRRVYPEVPPKVEYSFTELGKKLTDTFYALEIWGSAFLTAAGGYDEVRSGNPSCYTMSNEEDRA